MPARIVDYELWRIQLPAGMTIGDSMCHYDKFSVTVLCLKSDQGHWGWGFGEKVTDGVFTKPAPWHTPMATLAEIRQTFSTQYWPVIRGHNAFELKNRSPSRFGTITYLHIAIREALWDLMGKELELPLYRLLGGTTERDRVRAYGSGLSFALNQEQAVARYVGFVQRGMMAVKVKVGHEDPQWDVQRLRAVQEAVGPDVEIAIDANIAWTAEQTIDRVRLYRDAGIDLAYVEDPLPLHDTEGFKMLADHLDLDVVGHEYTTNPHDLRKLLEINALDRLRFHTDIDNAVAVNQLAEEFDLTITGCNTLFEVGIHAAAAMPRVERIEFADLAWNELPEDPVKIEDGYMIAPSRPGHGFDPKRDMLEALSHSG